MWPLLIGAALGAIKGNQNVKKQAENDKFRKAAIAMSPWTNMGDPGALNLPGMLDSTAQGAAMGAMTGNMFGGAGGAAAGGGAQAGASQMMGAQAADAFGSGSAGSMDGMQMAPAMNTVNPQMYPYSMMMA